MNFTKDDLKKVIRNHNKQLKKERISLAGDSTTLLAKVKAIYSIKKSGANKYTFTHTARKRIKYEVEQGTDARKAQDTKFKKQQDEKKSNALTRKKLKVAKKKADSDKRVAEIKQIRKTAQQKIKIAKELKLKNKVSKKPKPTKLLKSRRTDKIINNIKIKPKLAKINPKLKESLQKKKQSVKDIKFFNKIGNKQIKKKLNITKKDDDYDITWTFSDKNIKKLQLARDSVEPDQLRLNLFYKNKGAEPGIATTYLKQMLIQLISDGDIKRTETITATLPLMNALDDGNGTIGNIREFDDYRPLPPKIIKKIENTGKITLLDFKQIINGLLKNYIKLGFKLTKPLSTNFKTQNDNINIIGKVSDILKKGPKAGPKKALTNTITKYYKAPLKKKIKVKAPKPIAIGVSTPLTEQQGKERLRVAKEKDKKYNTRQTKNAIESIKNYIQEGSIKKSYYAKVGELKEDIKFLKFILVSKQKNIDYGGQSYITEIKKLFTNEKLKKFI